MTKKQLIKNIQNALQADILNIGEDTFNDCPIHKTISKDEEILIETIYRDGVLCSHYIHGIFQVSFKLSFEEISIENLNKILDNVLEANEYLLN